MEKELEVKVLGVDLDKLEKKIIDLKGKLIADEFQINTLIDSTKNPIKDSKDAYLRIRETTDLLQNKANTEITLKKNIVNKELRENLEITSMIGEKDALLLILKNLGFDKIEVGEKKRRSYELKGARIDLDKWDKDTYPYPYIEIEVKKSEDLRKIIKLLEISEENVTNKSILELKNDLK